MARIRTVKPEFWEDEVVGLLSRDARLLFIATFNLADDEGLLRWTPPYVKATVFMYDEDLSVPDVSKLMSQLTDAGLLFPFIGGVARQQMACVVNFRKHQKVNRPQPSRLPAPSLQNSEVRQMYARRDAWTCHRCGGPIPEYPQGNDSINLTISYLVAQAKGGTDHPSNVRAAHRGCSPEGFTAAHGSHGRSDSLNGSLNDSVNESHDDDAAQSDETGHEDPDSYTQGEISSLNDSVNESVTDSPPEGNGREGKGRGEKKTSAKPPADDSPREDVEAICRHLADRLEQTGSPRPPITAKWRNDTRLLLDRDGISVEQAFAAIDWAHADKFWQAHILSPAKLRQKYETLRRQATAQRSGSAPPAPPTAPETLTAEELQDALNFG